MLIEKLKRSLVLLLCFTIISSNIPFNTLPAYAADDVSTSVETSVASDATPLSILENQILSDDKDLDLFEIVSMLISHDAFYETFMQLSPEMRQKFYDKLSNEELNQLLFYAEMIFVKKVIETNYDTSEDTMKILKDYATVYAEFVSKEESQTQASEKDVVQAVSEAQNLYFTLENSFQNAGTFDEYCAYLQDATPIDIETLINQLRQVRQEILESSLGEFELYLLSSFENAKAETNEKELQEEPEKDTEENGSESKEADIIITDFIDVDENVNEPYYSAYLNDEDRKNVPSYFPEEVKVETKDGESTIKAEWEPINEPYTNKAENAFQYRLVLPEGYALSKDLQRKFDKTDAETPYILISVSTTPDAFRLADEGKYQLSDLADGKWKQMDDKELNKYFIANSEGNIYEFFANLSWEDQEELIKRDTLLSQEVDIYTNNSGGSKKCHIISIFVMDAHTDPQCLEQHI